MNSGYSHKSVMINKDTFKHPLESDGCVILDVQHVVVQVYHILNDDGGLDHGEDCHEKFKGAVVLYGDSSKDDL